MTCAKCGTPIRPGQLYIGRGKNGRVIWPRHVACPTPEEIAHRKRMGRL